MVYFSLWGIGFHSLITNFRKWSDFLDRKKLGKQALLAFALAIALGISMVQIYPPYAYTTTDSVRGSGDKTTLGHAVSWSIHPEEAASMVLPNFIGSLPKKENGKSITTYWGRNAFKLNSDAIGTMLWLVGLFGLIAIGVRKRETIFWITVVSVAITYALGIHTGIFPLFYNYLPGVKHFRAASMVLYWVPFALAYLGALGLPKYWESTSVWAEKRLAIVFGSFLILMFAVFIGWDFLYSGAGIVVVILMDYLVNLALSQVDKEKWQWKFNFEKWKSRGFVTNFVWNLPAIVIGLTFINSKAIDAPGISQYFRPLDLIAKSETTGIVFSYLLLSLVVVAAFYFAKKQKFNSGMITLTLVALLELIILNTPFIQTVPLRRYINKYNSTIRGLKEAMPDRKNDYRVLSLSRNPILAPNSSIIYGLRNGAGFHDNEIATYSEFRGGSQSRNFLSGITNNPYLDIANIKYIIVDDKSGSQQVYQNPTALPHVKLFGATQKVANPIEKLKSFPNYHTTLLYSDGELPKGDSTVTGSAKIIQYPQGDHITVSVEASAPATLFLSENYYKYWKAKVNGKETPIVRAFGTFQAVAVPAGKSTVEFVYRSGAVAFAKKFVYASLFLYLLMAVWAFLPKKKIDE